MATSNNVGTIDSLRRVMDESSRPQRIPCGLSGHKFDKRKLTAAEMTMDEQRDQSPLDLMAESGKTWCLYLIECRNGSYYAGITNRLDARYAAHVAGRGARYTRANPPLRLLGFRNYADRSSASRAEWQIKQLPREQKLAFLNLAT